MRSRVPWWLPPLAIPFWGAVLWLNVNSPLRYCAEPVEPVHEPAAVESPFPFTGLPGCVGAYVVRDARGNLLHCDWSPRHTMHPRPTRGDFPLGDFPEHPGHLKDLGRGERGFPTLRLDTHVGAY